MNLFSLLQELETVDPELNDRFNPRRSAIKNITSFGSKVAVAALPFAIGTLFNRAYGQTIPQAVLDTLNFALKLEYLESEFYKAGGAINGFIPAADGISFIAAHEVSHVKFLQSVLGTNAVALSSQGTAGVYDFTAKGTFPTVLTNYDTFLAVANAFEDTGVRAYKGAAPNLLGQQVYLTAALNIHSVEARHAAHLRSLRRARSTSGPGVTGVIKPWVSGSATVFNDSGVAAINGNYGAGASATFPAENNTVQAGISITGLAAVSGTTSITAAIEAFDEPLDAATVATLVAPFGVK